jgi:hypothetical protein
MMKLVLVLAGLLSLQSQGYRLMRNPQVGQTASYRMSVEIEVGGMNLAMSGVLVEKVTDVQPGGKYTVESRQTQVVASLGDRSSKQPDTEPQSAVYAPSGELVEIKGSGVSPEAGRLARLNAIIAPEGEVQAGQGWTHLFTRSPLNREIAGRTQYKVIGTEQVGSKNAVVVEFEFQETGGETPATSSGKAWIEAATAELLKLEAKWKNAPLHGADEPLDATVKLVRES